MAMGTVKNKIKITAKNKTVFYLINYNLGTGGLSVKQQIQKAGVISKQELESVYNLCVSSFKNDVVEIF